MTIKIYKMDNQQQNEVIKIIWEGKTISKGH